MSIWANKGTQENLVDLYYVKNVEASPWVKEWVEQYQPEWPPETRFQQNYTPPSSVDWGPVIIVLIVLFFAMEVI